MLPAKNLLNQSETSSLMPLFCIKTGYWFSSTVLFADWHIGMTNMYFIPDRREIQVFKFIEIMNIM